MRCVTLALLFIVLARGEAVAIELKTGQGMLNGTVVDEISAFKDIPFATPPVGDLRWRAPRPASAWRGVRQASEFGPVCPQNQRFSIFVPKLAQSEDCLTLNVWTPNPKPGAKLPVMVWIHGGGFLEGGSAVPLYDGTDLAKHGVVVVTINYRLGVLGFFAHPSLLGERKDEASGNFGLLDQIAALQWVRDNVASFGGDPSAVTIFGESAGGVSVNDLIASPMARGLFKRAISESGLGLSAVPTLAEAESDSTKFAAKLAIAGNDAATLARLRGLKVADILKNQGNLSTEGHVVPFIDGKAIPADVSVLFAKGDIAKVDYIAGSNSNEASLAPALGMDPVAMLGVFGDRLATVRSIYETDGALSDKEFGRQVFGDALFTSGAQALAGFVAKTGKTARVYQFAYLANILRGKSPGVGHGGELIYVFGLRGIGLLGERATDEDRRIVDMVQTYWTNFAKTGDPDGAGLPAWPAFSAASQQTLAIDDTTRSVTDFRKAQVGVMEAGWSKRVGMAGP